MCYIFKSMKTNRLLNAGDTIALGTPIFTPYLEMPHLEDYDLKIVNVQARQENRWQFDDEELKKLLDPTVKAFFLVNPGNPSAVALSEKTIAKIGAILKKRPDLILLTDDVYGTFVPGFRSLLGAFPYNTIGVYSYSKYFGCTGWRLGVIAVHEDNLFDKLIAQHRRTDAEEARQALQRAHARAAQAPVHRPHRRRQPRRGAEPHRGPVAAAAGDDDAVLALRADGREEELPEGLHRHRQEARRGDARGPRHRGPAERALRLLLRPDRPRVLGAQVRRRGRRQVDEGERAPARLRVPARRGPRHRAAERQRVRGAGLVGARVVREPERPRLRRHRACGACGGTRLPAGVRGIEGQRRRGGEAR